ncbi:hypothetical protein Tsubulata_001118 [Turnera subulata]|uniref:Uncharacterized protein n=1 Tax=Turnera subulata TaxID=218843 RepID=A0A9Q0G270_9ROSI|nr:hypothetical protein Tsubulata_001118 [Turnera subulata]
MLHPDDPQNHHPFHIHIHIPILIHPTLLWFHLLPHHPHPIHIHTHTHFPIIIPRCIFVCITVLKSVINTYVLTP